MKKGRNIILSLVRALVSGSALTASSVGALVIEGMQGLSSFEGRVSVHQ